MPVGLMIEMMSPGKMAVPEPKAQNMQASSYFEPSGRLSAACIKENAKQSVSFNDASCSPRIGAVSPAASKTASLALCVDDEYWAWLTCIASNLSHKPT